MTHLDGRRLQQSSSPRVKSSEVGAKVVCWEPESSGICLLALDHRCSSSATARYPKAVSTKVHETARRRAQANVLPVRRSARPAVSHTEVLCRTWVSWREVAHGEKREENQQHFVFNIEIKGSI